jgi:ABC-type bacteriocin/lantibiotic exporter with double-glycine peptidase domain
MTPLTPSSFQLTRGRFKVIHNLFSLPDKIKLLAVTVLQIILGVLDLVGVAAIGMISALAINGVQSRLPGDRVTWILEKTGMSNFSFHDQIVILGIAATVFFIGRTVLSILITKKVLNFLALRGAGISSDLISRLYSQELPKVLQLNVQETSYRVTYGVNGLMLGTVGTVISIIADSALLIVMLVGLMFVNTSVALATLVFFSLISFILYSLLNTQAKNLGTKEYDLSIATFGRIHQLSSSFRELSVRNQRQALIEDISTIRHKASATAARLSFLPSVSKYVMEAFLILGIMAISASQFFSQSNSRAVSTLAIFMAAGSRIAPAVLRLQQGGLALKHSHAASSTVLKLIEDTTQVVRLEPVDAGNNFSYPGFDPTIYINDLTYKFPNSEGPLLQDLALEIPAGQKIAIVGPSGSGKTTLVDLILGVRFLQIGQVKISGLTPQDAIKKWPGAISYVPQDVEIYAGTFRENVILGFKSEEFSDEEILNALEFAQLKNFALTLPDGLDSEIGERGVKLSGGQKQRVGIARAVLTNPKMIIFDEATSSLDGETESQVTKALKQLGSSVTVIVIAHRLSSIMEMDQVVYLADSKIGAVGTFEQVRNAVPDFDTQAKLMGL